MTFTPFFSNITTNERSVVPIITEENNEEYQNPFKEFTEQSVKEKVFSKKVEAINWEFINTEILDLKNAEDVKKLNDIDMKCMNTNSQLEAKEGYAQLFEKGFQYKDTWKIVIKWGFWKKIEKTVEQKME